MVYAILSNTVQRRISEEFLLRMMDGKPIERVAFERKGKVWLCPSALLSYLYTGRLEFMFAYTVIKGVGLKLNGIVECGGNREHRPEF